MPQTLGLPGPRLLETALRARSIRADPLAFLEQARSRYGELVALPVPGPPVLLVTDPDAVRQVLVAGARNWTKATRQYDVLAQVTGRGLLASAGPEWIERRRSVAPAFHHRRLAEVVRAVQDSARRTVASWQDLPAEGALVDVDALAVRTTIDVVGHTLFAHDLGPDTAALVAATDAVAQLIVARGGVVSPWPDVLPSRSRRRMRAAVAELDRVCATVIAARHLRGVGPGADDLLGLLIAAGLPDRSVRDELVTMVVAGHETVAAALTWTLLLLAEHPETQSRLREEVHSEPEGDPATLSRDLPWTRAVIDESLRINPPAWVLSRRANRPDSLAGQPVPTGTMAIISPWLVHHRASAWPEPDRFRPERFLGRPAAARTDYLPFGLGPRLCIGHDFALVELTVLLAELLRDHRVGLPEGFVRPQRDVFITVRPRGGLPLRIIPHR